MTHTRFSRAILALALSAFALPAACGAAVFIVRRAEKEREANDREVPLSDAGRARAKRIAEILRDAGIVAIYSTDTVRTLSTAQPLANAAKLQPVFYDASPPDAMKTLAERIRKEHATGNVLVVGHSNTIAPLVHAIGVADDVQVAGSEYDGLWVVVPSTAGGVPTLLRLRQ